MNELLRSPVDELVLIRDPSCNNTWSCRIQGCIFIVENGKNYA